MKRLLFFVSIIILFCVAIGCKTPAQSLPAGGTVVITAAPEVESITINVDGSEVPKLTPIPTPTPAPTPEPTPTPTPSPEPTPEATPTPSIVFVASLDYPLPDGSTKIQKDSYYWIDGTVISSEPLVKVSSIVYQDNVIKQRNDVTFKASHNVMQYQLLDNTFSKSVSCLSEQLNLGSLPVGTYQLVLQAEDSVGNVVSLANCPFEVSNEQWIQLVPNNLRGNYTIALNFFGSPEKFMFRYKLQEGSTHITVDPEWRKAYDGEAIAINGKKWRCHIDAVPYFEKACRYLETTYIHISGKKLDTGAVCLADLVTFNGTIVRRFTNNRNFLSHHSFGTAVDINAYYPSHRDVLENRKKIYNEVTKNLTYNGIVEINGKQCYDFTYTGTAKAGLAKVPEPLMNYLLYEFGFYRAGFSWGVYYPHTSDAMHFTLTELSPSYFTDGEFTMRKVFTYIEDLPESSEPAETSAPDEVPESSESTSSAD